MVQIGAAHALPHVPSMTCSDFYPLLCVHLIQKCIILITQGKFKTLCSLLLWWPFWWIQAHFGAFWCTSCSTPKPLHDLPRLLSSFKCSSYPKMDYISHSGQIRNALLCHVVVTILVHFDAFWCILVHLMCDPLTPPWLALTPLPLQVSIKSRNGSY